MGFDHLYRLWVTHNCIANGFQLFVVLNGYGFLYPLWVLAYCIVNGFLHFVYVKGFILLTQFFCIAYGFQLYMLWVLVTSLEKRGKTFV